MLVLLVGYPSDASASQPDAQNDSAGVLAVLESAPDSRQAGQSIRDAGLIASLTTLLNENSPLTNSPGMHRKALLALANATERRDGHPVLADHEQIRTIVRAIRNPAEDMMLRMELAEYLPMVTEEHQPEIILTVSSLVRDPSFYISSAGLLAMAIDPRLASPQTQQLALQIALAPVEANEAAWKEATQLDNQRRARYGKAEDESGSLNGRAEYSLKYRVTAAVGWLRSAEAPAQALATLQGLDKQDEQVFGLGYIRSRVVASTFPPPNPQRIGDITPVEQRRIAEILRTAASDSGHVSEYAWLVTTGLATVLLDEAADGQLPPALQELAEQVHASMPEGAAAEDLRQLLGAAREDSPE